MLSQYKHRYLWVGVLLLGAGVIAVSLLTNSPVKSVESAANTNTRPAREAQSPDPVIANPQPENPEFMQPLDNLLAKEEAKEGESILMSEAKKGWDAQAEAMIAKIAQETFAESLQATANWEENYFRIVHAKAEALPSLPRSLHNIYLSRRWAKLLESIENNPALLDEVVTQLQEDVPELRASVVRYGSLIDQISGGYCMLSKAIAERGKGPAVVLDVVYRLNVGILLVAQKGYAPASQAVIDVIDTLGEDTNWSVAGFYADKVLGAADPKTLNLTQQAVVEEYIRYKKGLPDDNPFKRYERAKLPKFSSVQRNGDRAVAMGSSVDTSEGAIQFETAPIFDVMLRSVDESYFGGFPDPQKIQKLYCFESNGYLGSGRRLFGMLRRFHEAGA